MKKIICLIFFSLLLTTLFDCATASGTVLVTGKQRPESNPNNIVIYTDAPKEYEIIGIVTASSDSGLTEQEDLNYAMGELRKQAAKIGANGIILENINTSNSGGIISYGIYIPITAKNVSGKAIYVSENRE